MVYMTEELTEMTQAKSEVYLAVTLQQLCNLTSKNLK